MSTPGSAHEIFAAAADLAPEARGAFLEAKWIPTSRRATRLSESASRIVRLYEARDKLEPGTGKADKAAPWRSKSAP